MHQGFRYTLRQLCLNIHTHWKVGNCMGKCIKSLDAFHRIEPCSYTASYTQHLIVLSQLARCLVSLPSIIPSTETDSSSPKSKISHERISLKLTADRSSSLRVTCRTHARTFIKSFYERSRMGSASVTLRAVTRKQDLFMLLSNISLLEILCEQLSFVGQTAKW